MAQLKLNNIYKKWGDTIGVNNANLDIADNEFIVILGPSGCGKTTMMRMIAGLEKPSNGEIIIDGVTVNNLEPKERDIAMVFQNYGLYPHLSVYENIRFPLRIRKTDPNQQENRVKKAADMVELGDLLTRKPKELSGGQRQRVALARAIVREPNVFLMDEPLSNLDAKLRVSTRAQIKNLQHELSVTTIYVTHDQIEAMTLADRVVVMNQGKIQQVASPSEIYNNPVNTFVAGFIGSPPMNIISGNVKNALFSAPGIDISAANIADGAASLGFRAEDAQITNGKKAPMSFNIFSLELLGDATLINIKLSDGAIISIKADKQYHGEIGDTINVDIDPKKCHFFDAVSGERIQQ